MTIDRGTAARVRGRRVVGAFAAAVLGMSMGPAATAAHASDAAVGSSRMAADLLSQLRTHALASLSPYDRSAFLTYWSEHGGCDTRDEVLRRDLHQLVINADGCRVMSGTETDPYTGTVLHYVRGHSTVDIDHVVALGDAWTTGASTWPASERKTFANDPLNLLAVSSHANRVKGDGDASEWLPRVSYDCAYVARQIAVKAKYALWVTRGERSSMRAVLARCPTQRTPTAGPLVR